MTTAGDHILKSAKQALAFAEGEKDHGCAVHIPEEINVRRIRQKLDMSQKAFAEYFGVLEAANYNRMLREGVLA